jgi:exopolyphosphatase/guanosine-5'-triphosphate,3'-diphosphate pyrophosphatase
MPGFTDKERRTVAALCRFHRKSMPQARHADYQALEPDARRQVLLLAPLLRLADSLDRAHEQKVKDVTSAIRDGNLILLVHAEDDIDLEIWSANEAAKTFREVYGKNLMLQRAKANRV